eukprot:TRINITY_DN4871_c3_g2_i3.p1 TRINITY_DN4871_c3_g2~~TRINITY_DN4871_c3_g2_i3.p1  ORF type:complete len:205 (+),score=33.94 TRINITY_DN4871_c3_g2_i3:79-615(+)
MSTEEEDVANVKVGVKRISNEEAALYDRQIRLWGVDAQNSMRNSAILLIGMHGFNVEVAKNIVLAGVGRVMVLDEETVQAEDLGSSFFLRDYHIGTLRAEATVAGLAELNPRVDLSFEAVSLLEKDPVWFEQFHCVVMCSQYLADLVRWGELHFVVVRSFLFFYSLSLKEPKGLLGLG